MKSLYSLKPWLTRTLKPVLKLSLRWGISPDFYSLLNVVFGVLAGFAITWLNFWFVLLFVVLRLVFANLDGALARAKAAMANTDLPKSGFIKNEIGDRLADFGMLSGLIFLSHPNHAATVALAVVIAATPTLISLIAVRRGLARMNGGPFGKTERCFAVVVIVGLANLTGQTETCVYFGAVVILLGSLITAWGRYLKMVRS